MDQEYLPKVVLDPFSLLLVNKTGILKRLYCPFWVVGVYSVEGKIKCNETYLVEMVKSESSSEIIFIIRGKSYKHFHFKILAT